VKKALLYLLGTIGIISTLNLQQLQGHPHQTPLHNGVFGRDANGQIIGCGMDGDQCHWSKPTVAGPGN